MKPSIQSKNGKNDTNDVVLPEIVKILNEIFGQYNIEEIHSFKRSEIESLILKKLRSKFKEDHIKVDAILFVNIQFSEIIKKRIEENLLREVEKNNCQ
ncbi:SPFH domain-containing protein [Labilibaculum sp. K2S]|uniref:SPFH domain-containing protein n=1 Tax=Labilibaculum sp. K2S TaxID=3056386 RepID=UPI0025A4263D|nr:SPFH domain-containing protein [Labilibaculum sp. K2S]MDM8159610.1 SPFH domain-containing protein [Labilibaculum sp. K2S]